MADNYECLKHDCAKSLNNMKKVELIKEIPSLCECFKVCMSLMYEGVGSV